MKKRTQRRINRVFVLILGFFLAGRSVAEPQVLAQRVEVPSSSVQARDFVENAPRTPEEGLRSIRVAPGFRVELVASEPLVADPIAFDWGADGRLWVVEMGDYPLGLDGKGAPGGSVKILEDRDGDGRYDTSTVFLGGLGFPTGVMPWRNGVLISRAPDILYAEDTNGDGKADRVEVVLTGFVPGNPQHRVNGFDFGLDGFVYAANGDSGGTIRAPGSTNGGVSIRGRDFRFDPDSKRFELESGQTQFGRHRDDWGRWFGNNNSVWAWHFVLTEHALKRNPSLALASPRQPLDLDPRLFPDSQTLPRFNNPGSANKVTSANSPTPYRDDLFGPSFGSTIFVSEPVHNLVRRMTLTPDGPTFVGKGVFDEQGREFLASTDTWFRPTMLKTGPDGALWIADMYRAVIEHPEWIPDDVEAKIDLRAGADRGRIYRVVPVEAKRRPIPRLDRLDTSGLVQALDSPSGWQRDTAQRLLGHRRDPASIEPLRRLVRTNPNAKTRVQALWAVRNQGGLDRETTLLASRDAHPQVRKAAIEAGASREILDRMISLVEDPDAEVRFALAIALGDIDDPRAGQALGRLAIRDGKDPWSRAAILSSAGLHAGTILAKLFEESGADGPAPSLVGPLFATACSRTNLDGLAPLVDAINTPKNGAFAPWQFSAAVGLAEAADRTRSPERIAAIRRLSRLTEAARGVAKDDRIGRRPSGSTRSGCSGDRRRIAGSGWNCSGHRSRPSFKSRPSGRWRGPTIDGLPTSSLAAGTASRLASEGVSWTPCSPARRGPQPCSRRSKTSAFRPPRFPLPTGGGSSIRLTPTSGDGLRQSWKWRRSPRVAKSSTPIDRSFPVRATRRPGSASSGSRASPAIGWKELAMWSVPTS